MPERPFLSREPRLLSARAFDSSAGPGITRTERARRRRRGEAVSMETRRAGSVLCRVLSRLGGGAVMMGPKTPGDQNEILAGAGRQPARYGAPGNAPRSRCDRGRRGKQRTEWMEGKDGRGRSGGSGLREAGAREAGFWESLAFPGGRGSGAREAEDSGDLGMTGAPFLLDGAEPGKPPPGGRGVPRSSESKRRAAEP